MPKKLNTNPANVAAAQSALLTALQIAVPCDSATLDAKEAATKARDDGMTAKGALFIDAANAAAQIKGLTADEVSVAAKAAGAAYKPNGTVSSKTVSNNASAIKAVMLPKVCANYETAFKAVALIFAEEKAETAMIHGKGSPWSAAFHFLAALVSATNKTPSIKALPSVESAMVSFAKAHIAANENSEKRAKRICDRIAELAGEANAFFPLDLFTTTMKAFTDITEEQLKEANAARKNAKAITPKRDKLTKNGAKGGAITPDNAPSDISITDALTSRGA